MRVYNRCIHSVQQDADLVLIDAKMILRLIRTTFQKYPVVSNAVTYTGLYLTAEVSQQIITKKVLVSGNSFYSQWVGLLSLTHGNLLEQCKIKRSCTTRFEMSV